ncbi:hypothetical protein GQ457_08G037230 [Hibiscus cannabinus]
MERNNNNNGQPPADEQDLSAHADGAIAPPVQQMNQQLPARTVRDYLAEDLEGLNPAVTMPDFEAEHFELKPVMFNMLNTLGQFGGTPNENARQHFKSFLEICNSFKIHGVSNDVLKLKLFPYSLRDKAKIWLNNLQPGSLQSWTQLCRSFRAKFSYTNMIDHLRNQITSFRHEDDEAMQEAWERYRDLFRRCPMHGLPEWTQVSIFYNSVNTSTRMMLDASANGTLLDKPPRESLEILNKLAQNDYQHPISRRGNTRRGPAQLYSSDTILAQIDSLTNMVKNMQKQPHIQEVKALDAFWDQCGRKMAWVEHCLVINFGEVVGPDGVENNEDGHVLGETEVVGLVGVENNEDVHVLGETKATGLVGGVGPVLGERGDGDNEGGEKVGRYVNADSSDITTDATKSDEDDDSKSKDLSVEGWLTNEDDEEISQIFNNKRKFKSRNLGDEHQEAQAKRTATDSQRKESSVEDESSDIDYIESDDPDSYETDSEGELCVKKGSFGCLCCGQTRYIKNDPGRTRAKCKGIGCPYMIYASLGKKDRSF